MPGWIDGKTAAAFMVANARDVVLMRASLLDSSTWRSRWPGRIGLSRCGTITSGRSCVQHAARHGGRSGELCGLSQTASKAHLQCATHFVLDLGRNLAEELDVPLFCECDVFSVLHDDGVAMDGRDAGTLIQNAAEIERVGGGDDDPGIFCRVFADFPQPCHGLLFGVLFASHTGDKTSASNFASQFHPSVETHQFAPRRCGRFPGKQIAKHDTISTK